MATPTSHVSLQWQQMPFYAAGAPNHHEQGMRVECDRCGVVAYTGDDAEGDREAARVKVEHRCPDEVDTYALESGFDTYQLETDDGP